MISAIQQKELFNLFSQIISHTNKGQLLFERVHYKSEKLAGEKKEAVEFAKCLPEKMPFKRHLKQD
ncbi:hypothetical protein [[Haemophilus] ducreyi]|uniref:Uncharacterized protein n=1 Tax=Haemophilus ducreyi TaxID=730 RepID=A0AAC8ZB81_HAEDC|nr:hypothetical protein [[Haemophilus] ducreyi]AKO32740.1 hypothetical protein RZ57_06355 [[Haemophilus] ducreyi]AKO34189.1 hypothetical protein RZ58_06345 [[Haemophilus] ducreyi]AKO35632.1 hypothetical protein RZ59_06275 [[Haemophilus] ducreyi]AKO40092.1 hypothetical protein RZ63_06505 [[Haemophilus] ducreyi]ANF64979.1 hypothetical protein A6039_05030 [[Haemophilus] ducreyi]